MLERCYARPKTVDRIRSSWLGAAIEQYATWFLERGYSPKHLGRAVPILLRFGTFAYDRGARCYAELPPVVRPFVEHWITRPDHRRAPGPVRPRLAQEIRRPIEQMLRLIVPGFVGTQRPVLATPFIDQAPGFFAYLRDERGLRAATLTEYTHHLRQLAAYLRDHRLDDLRALSPVVISGFLTDRSRHLSRSGIACRCVVLRVFLRYLHREGLVARDLSRTVETPRVYRLAKVPRSIQWDEVRRMLEAVDRRTVVGRRDYAMLLLLVTYGLRAREVAALTLDDIDWSHDRLRIPERKAGHSTAYPLSPLVGGAIIDYLKSGRPTTQSRRVFFRIIAPCKPIESHAVSCRVTYYLREAGIVVPRPGSHTLRHTCVQRLVDAGWPLKSIGDYVGHRSSASTEVYSKVAIETLREVACGDGEEEVV
ncbi:MAG: tyrosine-type recombinase/integrase [Chloroflexota bacterium]|nr:tyrosine-type recombinase/integrase [Chloroflexota bacterium]